MGLRTNGFRTQIYSMSFDGIVAEFPFLGVDRFNTTACIFLLTHCHQDHLVGLLNRSFSGVVYCTPQTRLLLASLSNNASYLARIKPLAYNTPTQIDLPTELQTIYGNITITLVPAYHCLGACMFLIEGEMGGSVLCTGDLRAEKWWVDGLELLPQLAPYFSGFKTLDNIYLDTTFGYRGEPYIEIPPNNQGVYTAIGLLKKYPMNDPEICFRFRDTVLGFDQAWAFIVSYFGASLNILDDKLKNVMKLVAEHDPVNGPAISHAMANCTKTPARPVLPHFVAGKGETSHITVRIIQCIDFNIMDLAGLFYPLPLESLSEAERNATQNPIRITALGNSVVELRDRFWILPKHSQNLLPIDIKLIFSRHSSYSECAHLISRFKPRQVYPCWSSVTAWQNGFSMSRLFGKYCVGSSFNYDTSILKSCGPILLERFECPVATIDRWNTGECEKEKEFVEQYLEASKRGETKNTLINVRKVAHVAVFNKERIGQIQNQSEYKGSTSLGIALSLDNLTDGGTKSVRAFIEAQQQLYYKKHNLPQYNRDFEHPMYHNAFASGIKGSSEVDSQSSDSSLDLEKMGKKRYSFRSKLSSSGLQGSVSSSYVPQCEEESITPDIPASLKPVLEPKTPDSLSLNKRQLQPSASQTECPVIHIQSGLSKRSFTFKQRDDSEIFDWMFSSFVVSSHSGIDDSIPMHKKRLVERRATVGHPVIL